MTSCNVRLHECQGRHLGRRRQGVGVGVGVTLNVPLPLGWTCGCWELGTRVRYQVIVC